MDILERRTFGALIRDLDYPRAAVGATVLEGEDGWARPTTRQERAALLAALADQLLVATAAGAARLAAWSARTPGTPPRPVTDACVFGDPFGRAMVHEALGLAPAPVREAAIAEVAFLAVGQDSVAWTSGAPFRDHAGRPLPQLVVLGPDVSVRTVAHEIAHAWHAPLPGTQRAPISVEGELALWSLHEAGALAIDAEGFRLRGERLAEAAAIAWLGPARAAAIQRDRPATR